MDKQTKQSTGTGLNPEKTLGKAYDTRLMARLWSFVKPHWGLCILAFLLIPVTVAFELAQPYLLSVAIDIYISHHITDGLGTLALVYFTCIICHAFGAYIQIYALQLVGQRSMHTLRKATYKHLLSRANSYFDKIPVGRLMTRMTNDIESINEMFSGGVVTLIADFIRLMAIVAMMLYLNVKLTLITFITIPLLIVLIGYSRKLMRHSYRQIRVKLAAMNTHLQEHLSGIRVVQLFSRELKSANAYEQINNDYREAYEGSIRADASMYAIVEAIGIISAAAIAWYAGSSIGQTALSIGLVVAFIEYVNKFFIPIKDFSSKYAVMQSAMAAAERVVSLLDTQEEDAPALLKNTSRKQADTNYAFEFKNVTFGYRPKQTIIENLSLRIQPGEKLAIVGATGSGKSTLIKLLTRLYEIDAGSMYLSGIDIHTLPIAEVRNRITVVNQDVVLFTGSIRDNIRMGKLDASDEEIDKALRSIGAEDVLGNIRNRSIKERGENLSAGQRQLIVFARALIRNPEILVLDEATAHVDPQTEYAIEQGLQGLMKGRTTLIIAHRLSTIMDADKIVVLSKGKIIEQGTYQELLDLSGHFSQLEQSFTRQE